MSGDDSVGIVSPFNSALEVGLRTLCLLTEAYPATYSLQRLVVFDYLAVHSDDVPGGPKGIHPQTPYRSGELLVRRDMLQDGLLLYQSRGLIEQQYQPSGVYFSATETSASFLDALRSEYASLLRQRATWVVSTFGPATDDDLQAMVREHIGEWGAEFESESILWSGGDE